jgi:serine/threonine protein kinase
MIVDQDSINHFALSEGTRIGHYNIKSLLGQGGFSLVYLALDEDLGRLIALKEYLPASLATRTQGNTVVPQNGKHRVAFEQGRARFIEEA